MLGKNSRTSRLVPKIGVVGIVRAFTILGLGMKVDVVPGLATFMGLLKKEEFPDPGQPTGIGR